jgi:TfoX/Sxy family transcriptional regulator of competence genes
VAYDEALAQRIRGTLGGRPGATEKRMFGGLTFMVAGHMCCGVTNDVLVVRVGRDRYEAALDKPHARPCDFTGKPMKGMVMVPPQGYRGRAALNRWVAMGLAFVDTLPPKA